MRRLIAVAGLMLTGIVTTACVPPILDACPAIGYVTGLQVDATAIPDATWVQLCADAVCSAAPGEGESVDLVIRASEDGGTWAFSFIGIDAPDDVVTRVTDAAGTLLQETEHRVDWTRSAERCGGPSTADPIVLVS